VNRPAWTISEAVERTGASRSTIRRYRDAGKFPHAYKDSTGVWRFPLEDLLAAGLQIIDPAQAERMTQSTEQAQPESEQVSDSLLNKVTELERALAVEQARNAGLERLAQAAQENVLDLRRALRMLEVGKPEQVSDEPVNRVSEQAVNTPTEQAVTTIEQGMTTAEQVREQVPARASWRSIFKRVKN
jgi:DNA-binding transcriptional MerR regulator